MTITSSIIDTDERLVHIIAIPVSASQRERYYSVSKRINEMREDRPEVKPKKITQLSRESLMELLNEVESWLNCHYFPKNKK
jgi:hypothetical protein